MTNRSSHSNSAFLLKAAYKDYLWGGNRLAEEYGKDPAVKPIAESWECSVHPAGQSVAATGEYAGSKLGELVESNYINIGSHMEGMSGLPVLVKLIDASDDLSVQVHPSDEDVEDMGKAEMWYILDAKPGAYIYYGLRRDMTEEEIRRAIDNGSLRRYLNKVKVKADEVYFIPPGTIHAIGGGVLAAEVQENSDHTYRLFDYNRKDKNGQCRELHIDRALSVARLTAATEPIQPMRVLNYRPGMAREFLCRCRYFIVERLILNIENDSRVTLTTTDETFKVLLCIEGGGFFDDTPFKKGDCIFVPASADVTLVGKATFIEVSC